MAGRSRKGEPRRTSRVKPFKTPTRAGTTKKSECKPFVSALNLVPRAEGKSNVGRKTTKNAFKEFNPEAEHSLEEWRKIFVDIGDLTEYRAAIELVGTWRGWQELKAGWQQFRDLILVEWLEEVEVKLRSENLQKIITCAREDPNSVAAKWIAEGKYRKTTDTAFIGAEDDAPKPKSRTEKNATKEEQEEYNRVMGSVSLPVKK